MNIIIKNLINQYKDIKINEQTKNREILQQIALLGLARSGFFEKAAFYGGTALRILYGLDRFSEDLDFTLLKRESAFNFIDFLHGMQKELISFGFQMNVQQKNKNIDTSVLSAFLKINTLEYYLSIDEEKTNRQINHNEKIQIKLEIETDPPSNFRVENHLIHSPVPFYVATLNKSDLFAGKMQAILYRTWKNRIKGRDWYDLIWYVRNKIPLNLKYLEERIKQNKEFESKNPVDKNLLVEMLNTKIMSINWEDAKADIRPFITEPQQLEIWSAQFFLDLIQHIEIERH